MSIQSGGGNFSKDPVTYVDRTELGASYGHTRNQYPEVQLKVTAAAVAAPAAEVIGVTLKQTLEADEMERNFSTIPLRKTSFKLFSLARHVLLPREVFSL